jgi:hypothetical protein
MAAIAFAAITCAYTWPLPALAGSNVAHDRGDPLLVTWILWWSSHTVPLTDAWWNAPAFYPSPGVFAFSENLLSLAPIATPAIWITGSPILAYNVTYFLSYVLCALAAYWLAFGLTRSHAASFVAGVAFAFAPYRLSHTQHLQLLSAYWIPVAIAALHRYLESPSWRWAALFSAAWVLQSLASGYYLFYLAAFAALWILWFMPGRLGLRDLVRLAVAWLGGAVLLAPILLRYRAIHASYGFRRSPVEVINYSADVLGVFASSPDSLLWSWLPTRVSAESQQFPGVTVLVLALIPLAKWGQSPFRKRGQPPFSKRGLSPFFFYAGAAVLMWAFSLGPEPRVAGNAIGIPGPYAVLAMLPGFDGMRVPARFWMMAVLCLAMVSGLAVAGIENGRTRRIVAVLAACGLLLDGWPRVFPVVAAPGTRVTTTNAQARLGLPLHEAETETMYGAIAQGRPVFNGYSGYSAPQHAALRDMLERHDPRILARLAATEPIEVVVEAAGDADGAWRSFVERQPGIKKADGGPGWSAYLLGPTGETATPSPTGTKIRIVGLETTHNVPDINAVLDDDLVTRWNTRPQAGGETITADLGSPHHVTAVVLCLGTYAGQYPRGLQIDVSRDGSGWTTVYTGDTALETYDAALRSPREIPITFTVNHDEVRYVRLRQTGAEPRTGWTIVELRVIG